jgi:predicted Zn-dependent peptidase
VIERHELSNGLVVCLSPNRSTPLVAVSLWYGVGSADEAAGRTGLAHLFEHLMFQGSLNIGKGEHFTLIQGVGGRANAATGIDRTFYYERLPSHQLELALWLEAERLAHLADGLDQVVLDNQRDVVRNERRFRIDNQPYGDAEEWLQLLLYPAGHPYAHEVIGSMDDLAAASLDDVRRFFETYYSPSNAVLSIVGDVDASSVIPMIERHFGGLPRGRLVPPRVFPADAPHQAGRLGHRVEGGVPLPRFYITYPIPPLASPSWDASEVVADLLGRGRASRLYDSLVRTERAQAVSAWTYPLVDDPARLTVDVTARVDAGSDDLVAAVLHELERLGETGPSEPELVRVRVLRRTEHAADMERTQERADRIGMYASLLGTPDRVDEEVARYEAVERDDVRDFVSAYLTPDRAVRLIYVPGQH